MLKALLFTTLTLLASAAEVGVSNNTPAPSGIWKINDINFPIDVALIGFSAVGLILTIVGLIYTFAQIDPSKDNIVYKLSYQRLKTD